MDAFNKLTQALIKSLNPSSEGGRFISESERQTLHEISSESPEVSRRLVNATASLFNNKDGEAQLSRMDLRTLQLAFPEATEKLIAALKSNCQIPATVRLFTSEVYARFKEPTAQDSLLAIAHRASGLGFKMTYDGLAAEFQKFDDPKNEIVKLRDLVLSDGFPEFVDELRRYYAAESQQITLLFAATFFQSEATRRTILSTDFREFIRYLKFNYDVDFSAIPFYVDAYLEPRKRTACLKPENVAIYRKIRQYFPMGGARVIDFEALERLRHLPDLDGSLARSAKIHKRLKHEFGNAAAAVRNPTEVERLIKLSEDQERLSTLLSPHVVEVAEVLEWVGYPTILFERSNAIMTLIMFAERYQGDLKDLLILREYKALDPYSFIIADPYDFYYDSKFYVDDVHRVVRDLAKPWVQYLAHRYPPKHMRQAARLVYVASRPHRDRLLSLADKLQIDDLFALGSLAKLAETELRNIEFVVEKFPRVRILSGFEPYEDVSDPDLISKLRQRTAGPLYDRAVSLLSPDEKLDLPFFLKLLRSPRHQMYLHHSKAPERFNAVCELLGSNNRRTSADLEKFIELSDRDLESILSEESRGMLSAIRRDHPKFKIKMSDAAAYAIQLDSGYPRFVKNLDRNGLLDKKGILRADLTHEALVSLIMKPVPLREDETALRALMGPPPPRFYTAGLSETGRQLREALDDPNLKPLLEALKRNGAIVLKDVASLPKLVALRTIPSAPELIKHVSDLLGRQLSDDDLAHLHILLTQGDAHQLLLDAAFRSFCVEVKNNILVPSGLSVIDLVGIGQFYSRQRPGEMTPSRVLSSRQFQQTLEEVRNLTHTMPLRGHTLLQLEKLAESLDFASIRRVAKIVGQSPSANDLFLLNAISKDHDLENLLSRRADLEREASTLYSRPAVVRKKLNEYIPSPKHSERPPLSGIDILSLIRIVLLKRALEKPEVLASLGETVSRDVRDKRTEYGGTIFWNGSHLEFNNVVSISEDDGSYQNVLDAFLTGGIMSFHLHALTADESDYSGPSGDPTDLYTGGDWGAARKARYTGIVITTLGEDTRSTAVKINVDLYYINPKGQQVDVDFGVYLVPSIKN